MNNINTLRLPPYALMQQDYGDDDSSIWGDRSLSQQSFRIRPMGMQPYPDQKLAGWHGGLVTMPPLEDPSKILAIDNQPVHGLPIFLHYEQVILMNSWKYRHISNDEFGGKPDVTRSFRQPTNYFGRPGAILRLPRTVIVPRAVFSRATPDDSASIGQYVVFDRVAAALGAAFDRENVFMCMQWYDDVPLTDYRQFPYSERTYPDYNFTTAADVNGLMYSNQLLTGMPWCGFEHFYAADNAFVTNHRFVKKVDGSQFIGGDLLVMQSVPDEQFPFVSTDIDDLAVTQLTNGIGAFRSYKQIIYPWQADTNTSRIVAKCPPSVTKVSTPPLLPLDFSNELAWLDFTDTYIIPEIRSFFNL